MLLTLKRPQVIYIEIIYNPHTSQTAYTAGYRLGVQAARDIYVFGTSLHPFRRSKLTNSYDSNSLLGIPTSRLSRDRGRARVGIPLRDPPVIGDNVPHRAHSIGLEILMR